MANKTVLQIEGRFDPSQILNSLKQIRAEMGKAGAKDSLFSGVDKELENAKKLLTNFMASMSQGVSNSKDIDKLNKEFDNLCKSLAKASTGMKTVAGESKNFNVNGPEIAKLQKTLEQATEAKKKLEESAKAALQTQMSSLKLNEGQQKAILKEINDQAKLEEAIKKVGKAKEQTYNQKFQQYVSGNSAAQAKTAEIAGRPGQSSEYATALTEAVQKGQTLAQLGERMKSIWTAANIPLADQEKYLDQIAEDYRSIIDAAYNTSSNQQKGQITQQINKYQNFGTTGADGNFQLNTSGQNMANAADFTAIAEATRQAAEAQQELNDRTSQAAQANQDYANSATNSLNTVEEEQRQVTEGFHNTTEAQRESMTAQEDLNKTFDSLKDTVKRVLSLSSAFSGFKRIITETFNDVKKLDAAFGSIAMVTNKTVSELWSSYGDYAEMANKLGQSTENAIKSSALFYQQGLDTAEALTLTEDTMKLATLSGQGFEEATKQMTAALRGFHMEMEQGSHITDVYSELAANAAADVHGIAYAMSKTASIASSAGMSFENTAAFLTNMIETTQEAPENIGTAMKTIIARFTELKENVSAADSEFDDLDYNKVDKALKSVGINLKDTNGQFRNLDDVFLELSSKWSTLDRNTQRYIATTAAGSRQQSRFIAMMEDYKRTMELVETAQDSAGKSEEQFAKYADTLTYKVNALKNTWEQLRMSLLDSDMFKGVIDGFNNFLSKVGKLNFKRVLITAIPTAFIVKNFITQFINSLKGSTGQISKAVQTIANSITQRVSNRSLGIIGSFLREDEASIQIYKQRIAELKAKIEELKQTGKTEDEDGNKLIDLEQQLDEAEQTLSNTEGRLKTTTQNIANSLSSVCSTAAIGISMLFSGASWEDSFKAMAGMMISQVVQLGAQLMSTLLTTAVAARAGGATIGEAIGEGISAGLAATGVGLLVALIASIIGVVVFSIGKWIKKNKENHKTLEEQLNTYKEINEEQQKVAKEKSDEAKESKQQVENLEKLKEEYEKYSNMHSLTEEEQEKYKEVTEQIMNDYPEIVTYYNEMTGELRVQKDLWEQILQDAKELALEDATKAAAAAAIATTAKYDEKEMADEVELGALNDKIYDTYIDLRDYGNANIDVNKGSKHSTKEIEEEIRSYLTKLELSVTDDFLNEVISLFNKGYIDSKDGFEEEELRNIVYGYATGRDERIIAHKNLLGQWKIKELQAGEVLGIKQSGDYSDSVAKFLNFAVSEKVDNVDANFKNSNYEQLDKDILSLMGVQNAKDYDKILQNDTKTADMEQQYVNAMKVQMAIREANLIELSDRQKEIIDQYDENLDNLTEKDIKKGSLRNLFGDSLKSAAEGVEDDALQTISDTKEKIVEIYSVEKEQLNDWTLGGLKAFDDTMSRVATNYGTSQSKVLGQELIKVKDKVKVSMADLTEIITANWDEVDLINVDDFKKNLLERLEASDEDKERIWDSYSKIFKDMEMMDFSTTSLDGLFDKLDSEMEKRIEASGKISKIISSQLEDGVISFSDSKTLEKELQEINIKAEDYLTYSGEGIIFDQEKLKNTLFENEELIEDIVNQTIAANNQKIEELETELAIYDIEKSRISNLNVLLKKNQDLLKLKLDQAVQDGAIKSYDMESYKVDFTSTAAKNETIDNIKEQLSDLYDFNDKLQNHDKETMDSLMKRLTNFNSARKEGLKIWDEAAKDAAEDSDKVSDALEKVAEAEEKVIDATKKLNEVLYGAENHKDALDLLYNYTTNLERLEKKTSDAKEALEDLGNVKNARKNMNDYLSNTHASIVNREAQNRVLEQSIANRRAVLDGKLNAAIAEINASGGRNLSTSISDYYTIVNDRLNVNHAAIDAAALPDDLKDYIHEQIQTINEEYDTMEENMDAIKDKEKELRDFQKKARDDYIKLEQKVVDTLKEKYEEEIKNNEDKNKALEEADNAYLDALKKNIDKQRKLRDEANAWDDLAEKQKKLSLMERDTSGANKKEVQKLQKDIKKTQQDLLDKGVDKIVEELKELYDAQKETRELEIEYQKAVIDNAQLIKEANDLINSWNAPEDMYEFMMNNTKNLSEMSQAQIEAEQDEWAELFDAKTVYMATSVDEFSEALEIQEDEIVNVVKNTSEVLTQEADRSLNEIKTKVQEAIESAEKALKDAIKGLNDARNEYNKLTSDNKEGNTVNENKQLDITDEKPQTSQTPQTPSLSDMAGAARNELDKSIKQELLKTNLLDESGKLSSDFNSDEPAEYVEWIKNAQNFLNKYSGVAYESAFKQLFGEWMAYLNNWMTIKDFGKITRATVGNLDNLNVDEIFAKLGYKIERTDSQVGIIRKYATGGLVNYTGPAWVDGTPDKPEAFLSPEDTQRIGLAAKLLASLPVFNYGSANNAVSSNVGDTSIEIHINVDSLGSDYDVDQLVERVKNDIVDIARPTGTPVILNKR